MTDTSKPHTTTQRFESVGVLLANAILRKKTNFPVSSKTDLIHAPRQSETCAREIGLTKNMPASGGGQTGLPDHSEAGDEI